MGTDNWINLKETIETQTGFACYEGQPGDQPVFYGTSDMLDDFKTLAGNNMDTGTIVYCMDTSDKYMYSKFKQEWYQLS